MSYLTFGNRKPLWLKIREQASARHVMTLP
jgi:hypothetical protein